MLNSSLEVRGLTCSPTNGLLVTGTTSTLTTTVTLTPVLDGKYVTTLTAITNQAAPTTDFNTLVAFPALVGGASVAGAYGNGAIAVYGLSAGVVKVCLGPPQALDVNGSFIIAPQFPPIPANFVPFAYQVLKAGATASATAIILGTASWNATGYTNAIVNCMVLPTRPQVS